MSDPSLDAAREAVTIPVVGPTQTSAFLAASLAHRFSILGTRADMGHKFVNQMDEYGISSKLASVQTVGLRCSRWKATRRPVQGPAASRRGKPSSQDGAHILIPGCTGMIGIAARLQAGAGRTGYVRAGNRTACGGDQDG